MSIYILILFGTFFMFVQSISKGKDRINHEIELDIYLFLLCLFLCFGYTTGTDWRSYEQAYGWVATEYKDLFLFQEPGYVLYTFLFSSLGIDFFHFLIFTKIVTFYFVFRAIRHYAPCQVIFLSLVFFIAWYAFFLFIDNPLRNLIAVSIFLSSTKYLREGRIKPYLFMTLLAISFHFSAIVMLLLYYWGRKKYSNRNLIVIYVICNMLLLSNSLIFSVASALFSSVPLVGDKIVAYSTGEGDGGGKLLSFGYLVHTSFFIFLLCGRKYIEREKNGQMIFMFAILLPIFFRLGLTITVMGRLQLYIAVFYVVAIGMLFNAFEWRSKLLYVFMILIVSIASCFSYMTKDSRYVPYTHYLLMDHDMSYDERAEYNSRHSPYK